MNKKQQPSPRQQEVIDAIGRGWHLERSNFLYPYSTPPEPMHRWLLLEPDYLGDKDVNLATGDALERRGFIRESPALQDGPISRTPYELTQDGYVAYVRHKRKTGAER